MDNNLRALRQAMGWSLRELAERISTADRPVHLTALARIEKGQQQLTQDMILRLSRAFGVSANTLLDVEGEEAARTALEAELIPVISFDSAGSWRDAIAETQEFVHGPIKQAAFGLRIVGDSMDKLAPDGGIVYVDIMQRELHDYCYYVVVNENSETIFRQYRSNPARLEPQSRNVEHQPIVLGQTPFTVIGKAIGAYRFL